MRKRNFTSSEFICAMQNVQTMFCCDLRSQNTNIVQVHASGACLSALIKFLQKHWDTDTLLKQTDVQVSAYRKLPKPRGKKTVTQFFFFFFFFFCLTDVEIEE